MTPLVASLLQAAAQPLVTHPGMVGWMFLTGLAAGAVSGLAGRWHERWHS